jgi:hypothetical protein
VRQKQKESQTQKQITMATIKIGRKEYEIKEGDYLLDNGLSIQFCSGDDRVLKGKGFVFYRNLKIAQGVFNKKYNPVIHSFRQEFKKGGGGLGYCCYYFTAQTIALLDKPNTKRS